MNVFDLFKELNLYLSEAGKEHLTNLLTQLSEEELTTLKRIIELKLHSSLLKNDNLNIELVSIKKDVIESIINSDLNILKYIFMYEQNKDNNKNISSSKFSVITKLTKKYRLVFGLTLLLFLFLYTVAITFYTEHIPEEVMPIVEKCVTLIYNLLSSLF